jgi:hypothetical protein
MSSKSAATYDKPTGTNLIIAIGLAILIAFIISGASLVLFLRSDTRETVQLIQQQTNNTFESGSPDSDRLDTTSMPTASDIDAIKQEINDLKQTLPVINSSEEYSDQALGL